MKTDLRFLIPIILFCWSCSKSEAPIPVPDCLLVEETIEHVADERLLGPEISYTSRRQFYYDEKYNLIRIVSEFKRANKTTQVESELKYNGNNQLVEEKNDFYRYVNEYNKVGKVAKQTKFNIHTGQEVSFYDFFYNKQGELAEVQLNFPEDPGSKYIWKYRYLNGDPVYKAQISSLGTVLYEWDMSYDDVPVPNGALAYISFEPMLPPSKHNMQSIKMKSWSSPNIYNLAYNEKGHLSTTSYSSYGIESKTTYTYKCK